MKRNRFTVEQIVRVFRKVEWTALMRAAHRDSEEVVQLLPEHHPAKEIADCGGATAADLSGL